MVVKLCGVEVNESVAILCKRDDDAGSEAVGRCVELIGGEGVPAVVVRQRVDDFSMREVSNVMRRGFNGNEVRAKQMER